MFTFQQGQYDLENPAAVNMKCSKTVSYTTKSGQLDVLNTVQINFKIALNKAY